MSEETSDAPLTVVLVHGAFADSSSRSDRAAKRRSAGFLDGRAWFRTRDLSRVKRALSH